MDEDEKEGREEVCVCGKMACVCVCVCVCGWVCDKVSDDVMNKDERDERERERRRRREKFGGSGFCDQIRMRPSKRNTLETTIKAIKWSYTHHGGQC